MADQPMDLSSLAMVEDAETVRHAVRRFRRRVLVRLVWASLAILAVSAIVGHQIQERNRDYRARIFEAPSWNGTVSTYDVEGVTIQVQKVTVIPDHRLGLVLVYAPARVSGRSVLLYPGSAAGGCPPSSSCTGFGSGGVTFAQSTEGCAAFCEVYLAIPIPTGREIPMTVQVGKGPPARFTISLDDLDVPSLEGR
jgi:hypothetical protein